MPISTYRNPPGKSTFPQTQATGNSIFGECVVEYARGTLMNAGQPDLHSAQKCAARHWNAGDLVVAGIAQVRHLYEWLEPSIFMHHITIPDRIGGLLELVLHSHASVDHGPASNAGIPVEHCIVHRIVEYI